MRSRAGRSQADQVPEPVDPRAAVSRSAASRCPIADLEDVVAVNLRRLRKAEGWTQEELADRRRAERSLYWADGARANIWSVMVLGHLAKAMKVEAGRVYHEPSGRPEARMNAACRGA